MTKQLFTSISHTRYNELMAGVADGSLLKKWESIRVPKTKSETVESRQIRAILMARRDAACRIAIDTKNWTTLYVYTDGTIELITENRISARAQPTE